MIVIPIILAAMGIGLAGLFLLAKAQKENFGKLYTVSSYITITFAALIIVFSISIALLHCCHGNGHGCGGGKGKCKTEQCHKSSKCGKKSSCGASASCSSSNSCSKSSSCSKGSSSCSKGSGSCSKGSSCGGMKIKKKIMKTIDGDSVNVDVKIITE